MRKKVGKVAEEGRVYNLRNRLVGTSSHEYSFSD